MIFSSPKLRTCMLFVAAALISVPAGAQTYSSACGLNAPIADNSCGTAPLEYDVVVSGAAGTQLGVDVVLASVSLIIGHAFDADVEISLQSPNGVSVPLSLANGLGGSNYGDPLDSTCTSVTTFSRTGVDGPINFGTPPFIGSFIPQGSMDGFNDNSDPNGTWKLVICDNFSGTTGMLQYVSLQFSETCEAATVDTITVTTNSATITFNSANPGGAYTLQYGTQGFAFPGGPGWINDISGTSANGANIVNIFGLSPATQYDFYLFEDCGLLQSPVAGPFSFTTNKPNDICSGAVSIACGDVVVDSTNTGATTVNAPAPCGVNQGDAPGLWYVFTGNGMDITVSTCGLNGYDTRLGVFEGPCLDLTCIAGNEDFCATQSQVIFASQAGKQYYIYVSGNVGQSGVFELSITCSANLVINEIDYVQNGVDSAEFIELKNVGSETVSLGGAQLLLIDGSGGGAVPYDTIDLPNVDLAAGDYFVICGYASQVSNCDLQVSASDWLRDGSPDAVAISVAGNILDAVSYNGNTGAPFTETSGTGLEDDPVVFNTGISRVPDGIDTDVNNADLSQRCISPGVSNTSQNSNCTVANDSCARALVIDPALNIPFNNTGANTDGLGDPLCLTGGSNQIYSDLWYSFTPGCDGIANFSTVGGTTYDTRIAVYNGSCAGAIIACDDDSSVSIVQSAITWPVISGTTYILRLGGFSSSAQDTGSFDLILTKPVAPMITCGADRAKSTDPGVCNAVVNPPATTAADNCNEVTLVNDFNFTDNALDTYPLGTTAVTWTATDASGNTATCTQQIIVSDDENPEIICPPDYVLTTDSGLCNTAVTVASPSVSDNCSLASVMNDFNGTPSASGSYATGITTVIWTVTDASSNTSTCSHTVTITDEEAPLITCPASLVIPNCGSFASVAAPTFSDNCSVSSLVNDFNGTNDASGTYPLGLTTVVWTVTDFASNTSTCSMTVTRSAPFTVGITPDPAEACVFTDLVLHGNAVVDSGVTVTHSWTGPVVGATNRDSVIFNLGIPGFYGPITYTVSDGGGCSASDVIFVTVNPRPKANIPLDVIETCEGVNINLNGNPTGGTPPLSTHAWTGDTAQLSSTVISNPIFSAPSGSYSLTYTVTDANNCKGSDNVSIIVDQSPSVSITPDPAEVCQNTLLTLNANLVPGDGSILTQGWTGNVGLLDDPNSPISEFSTLVPGTFNLIFKATDNNLCTAADTIAVVVNAAPASSFSGLQAVYCENDVIDTLLGTPPGGTFSGPGVSNLSVSTTHTGPDSILTGLNVVTQSVSLPGSLLGTDISLRTVCIEVQHPYVSDLDIVLESPSGKQVLLASGLCADGDDLAICIEVGTGNNIDLAGCSGGVPALSGIFNAQTGENLDSLNDGTTNPNGNWNLLLIDNSPTDDGVLVNWEMFFESLGTTVFNPNDAGPGDHTVIYTFTDSSGCAGNQSQLVTVEPKPVADAGSDVTICRGDSITLTATGGAIYTWNTGDNTASIDVSPIGTTTYTVTVSNSAGCEDVSDVMVTVNSPLVTSFAGLDTAYCLTGALDTLTGTPLGGTFSGNGITTVGGGISPAIATGVPVFIPSDTTTEVYDTVSAFPGGVLGIDVMLETVCFTMQHSFVQDLVVTLTSPGGQTVTLTSQPCGDFDDLDVCIQTGAGSSMDVAACDSTPPALTGIFTASSVAGDDLSMLNDSVTAANGTWILSVSDLATGDDGNVTQFSLNFRTFGITTFDPAAAGAGPHTIIYSFPNGNGCTGIDSATTTVRTAPPALIQPDTTICSGGSAVLTGSGGVSYSWSTGSSINPITVSPFNTATYTLTVTDAIGCTATDVVTVGVFPVPNISIGPDFGICTGTQATLNATGGVTYDWSTGDSLPSIHVSPLVQTTYSVTAVDANGCTGSDTITVSVNPYPVAVPGPNEDICTGGTVTISASGGVLYHWSTGATTNGTLTVSPATSTIYTVIVEDSTGCTDTTTVRVGVRPIPIAHISGLSSMYCNNNNPILLNGNPAGGTFSGPTVVGDTFFPALLAPGVYDIVYAYSDTVGCADTDTVEVTIMDAPTVTFTGLASEYCPDTVAHQLTGVPPGGVFSGPGISGGSSTFVSFFAGAGAHEIVYTYFAAGVCPGRDTQSVFVNTLPDVRILDLNSVYCVADMPDTIQATPAGGTFSGTHMTGDVFTPPVVVMGTPSIVQYAYVDTNGCLTTDMKVTTVYPNPSPVVVYPGELCTNDGLVFLLGSPQGGTFTGPGINNNVLVTAVAGAGTHSYQYTYTDVYGCAGDTTLDLTIHAAGVATFTGLDTVYCANAPVAILTGTPSGGVYSGPGTGANLFDPTVAGTGGPYDVVYIYTDTNNCVMTDTQTVSVINSPFAQIGGLDPVYCRYEAPVQINLFPSGGELSGSGVSNGMFSPNDAGAGTHIISYKVTNANGCSEIATFTVVVDPCVGIGGPASADVRVYPNPSEGRFVVEIKGNIEPQTVVRIYDLAGKVVDEERIPEAQQDYRKEFDLAALARGVYYLRMNFNTGVVVRKIVIE